MTFQLFCDNTPVFQSRQQLVFYAQLRFSSSPSVLFCIAFLQYFYHLIECGSLYSCGSPELFLFIFFYDFIFHHTFIISYLFYFRKMSNKDEIIECFLDSLKVTVNEKKNVSAEVPRETKKTVSTSIGL